MDDNLINLNIPTNPDAIIKVIGVGGGGGNAVTNMYKEGIHNVSFALCNTDQQALNGSDVPVKLLLGRTTTCGLGSGDQPERGRAAAEESEEEIRQMLSDGTRMAFITAGMGGGTGTGAAPLIAKIAKEAGALTVAVVTRPFTFEGRRRANNAKDGIEELKKYVDSLIIVSNDNLLDVIGRKPIEEAFQAADNVLRQGVQTISDLIAVPALVNLDFADVRSVMQNQGRALIGIGMAEGEDKAISAAEKAIQSPLLEAQISGAKSAIVNITGGDKVSLFDAQNAVAVIQDAAGGDVDCIFGIAINEQLGDAIIVTVIATGFEEPKEKQRKRRSEPVIKQVANDTLFTEPKIQAPVNPGVVTSVENNTSDDEQIPNFFFNR